MTISSKAMRGKGDFLFLNGKDSNDLLGHLQGEKPVQPAALEVHRRNRAVIERLTVPFLGIIVPEAHVIYPELLPEGMAISQDRPLRQVLPEMAQGYCYGDDILGAFKASGGTVYTGRDSHWTQTAALQTYLALRGRLGQGGAFTPAYSPSNAAETGDLSLDSHSQVVAAERQLLSATRGVGYHLSYASRILNHGNVFVAYNPKGQGRCLAFGTSFSTRLVPAYASDFRETVFCYGTTIDPFMVDFVQPDCVISELPERFLHFPSLAVVGSTPISLMLGLHDQRHLQKPLIQTEGLPKDLRDLPMWLAGASVNELGLPQPPLMARLEASDPQVARNVALLAPFLREDMNKRALRLVLSGQFYNRGVLGGVSALIDSGQLGLGMTSLIPDSEVGLLCKIRIYLRAGLLTAAQRAHEAVCAAYGISPEAAYYKGYIAQRQARSRLPVPPSPVATA